MNCSTSSKSEKRNPLTTGEMETSPFLSASAFTCDGIAIAVGAILEGVGALVSFDRMWDLCSPATSIPNTGKELTNAVEEFEKK